MDFGKLGKMAQSAMSGGNSDGDKQQQQNIPENNGNGNGGGGNKAEQEWASVGQMAKKAAEDFKNNKDDNKGPDYAELGAVAKKAAGAFQETDAGSRDVQSIGRMVAKGFSGESQEERKE